MVQVMTNQEAAIDTIESLIAQKKLKCNIQELMTIFKGILCREPESHIFSGTFYPKDNISKTWPSEDPDDLTGIRWTCGDSDNINHNKI